MRTLSRLLRQYRDLLWSMIQSGYVIMDMSAVLCLSDNQEIRDKYWFYGIKMN